MNSLTRPLPASEQFERLALGAAILDPANLSLVMQLGAEDFALEKHRRIFAAIQHLESSGQPIDRVTVAQRIIERGQLESVDGISYLTSLDDGLPQMYQLDGYVGKLREFTTRRKAIVAASALVDGLYEFSCGSETIEQATATLSALSAPRTGSPLRNAEEIITRYGGLDAFMRPPIGVVLSWWPKLAATIPCLQAGELWILGGRPGDGKTAMGCMIARSAAHQGIGTPIYSMEMPDGAILKRLISAESGVSFGRIWYGNIESRHLEPIRSAATRLSELPLWVSDNSTPTVAEIRSQIKKAERAGRRAGLVIVDYLQLVTSGGGNLNERVSSIARGLKLLAMDLKVPIVALSQLSRPPKENASWKPSLTDLRDSGEIEQAADGVIFTHASDKEKREAKAEKRPTQITINVAKQRNGPTGEIPMLFDGRFMRIWEPEIQ